MGRRSAPKTNLPVERGSFVGRIKLLDEIAKHYDGGARFVSLTGPAGIGKTRLALRASALELPRFGNRGGVWFVDVVEVRDASSFVRELLLVQGMLPEPGSPVDAEQARAYRALQAAGPMLLLLDGAQPSLAAPIASLVAQVPDVRVLVTTRNQLGVDDERFVKVGPLKLAKQTQQDAKSLAAAEAVSLFIERASEAKRGYAPTPQDLHAIASIVRQLDGVPLAIEIAAARLRALTAPELLERLPRKVALLVSQSTPGATSTTTGSARVALAGAVAWSLDLLPPWEQSALAQAAVFRGGFDVKAAGEVIDLSTFAEAPAVAVALDALLEKALLRVQDLPQRLRGDDHASTPKARVDTDGDAMRFEMPTVVRELIDARLGHDVAREALANRHAAHYLRVCSAWAEGVDGHGGLTLRRRLELENDNLVAAVRRALAADPQTLSSITTALRGVLALEPVLTTRGPHDVFVDLLDRALEPADVVGVAYVLRARGYEARGRARRARHELQASLGDLETALTCARKAKDKLLEARALANIGTHYLLVRKYDVADRLYADTLRLLDEVGERKVYGRQLGFSALLAHLRGDVGDAIRRYQDALEVQRDLGDRRWEGINEGQLGSAHLENTDFERARSHLKRALAIHKELHNRRYEAIALSWLGDLHALTGEIEEARNLWDRALQLHRQVADPRGEATALVRLAAAAQRNKLGQVALELFRQAREIIDRLDDTALVEMLLVLEGAIPISSAGETEPARTAAKIAAVLR